MYFSAVVLTCISEMCPNVCLSVLLFSLCISLFFLCPPPTSDTKFSLLIISANKCLNAADRYSFTRHVS